MFVRKARTSPRAIRASRTQREEGALSGSPKPALASAGASRAQDSVCPRAARAQRCQNQAPPRDPGGFGSSHRQHDVFHGIPASASHRYLPRASSLALAVLRLLSPPITRLKEGCKRKQNPKCLNLSIDGLGSLTDPLPPARGRGPCPQILISSAPAHSADARCKGCNQSSLQLCQLQAKRISFQDV